MTTRIALLAISVAALLGAVALIELGAGRAGVASASPTPSLPAGLAGPTDPASQPTDNPSGGPLTTAGPDATPISISTPRSTKAAGERSQNPEELTGYVWPLRNAWITSRFAPREFGGFIVIDGKEYHDGLDLATHCGGDVRAAHDGTVLYAGRNFDLYLGYQGRPEQIYARLEQLGRVNSLPIVVVIDDGNGYRSVYVHLKNANVEAGSVVRAGDIIGKEGMTGYATGCHLHYGLIRMDAGWQEVVPSLARFGYPPRVRERIDPLKVLPWGDEYAPQRLQDRAGASPSPTPTSAAS